jgi:hypothetical protein
MSGGDENADSQADAINERLLEKMGEPESGCGFAFCLLQPVPCSRLTEGHARHGGGGSGSRLGIGRTSSVGV